MNKEIYNEKYHIGRNDMTRYAAQVVIGELIKIMDIKTAIDLGGAIGVWIDELKKQLGEKFISGYVVDGDYIKDEIKLVKDNYITHDLEERFSIDKKFDIAISLETAEHLTPERGESFVEDLTKLSDVILFSACIPVGESIDHLNEREVSYWAKLFDMNGYRAFDIIRPNIQHKKNIPWWYRNNIILYCKKDSVLVEHFEKIKLEQPVYDGIIWDEYETRLKVSHEFNKVSRLYRMLLQWITLAQKERNISDYLTEKGYKNIAIYGMGDVGKLLFNELKNTPILVKYGIDKNINNIVTGLEIKHPEANLEKVDIMVVTAITYFDEIQDLLSKKIDCPIVNLESILLDLNK